MKLKSVASSMILAMAAGTVLADDQSVAFVGDVATFDSVGTVLAGGDDVITFTGLLPLPTTYNFDLTMSGQYLTLTDANLNGITGTNLDFGKWTFVGIDGNSSADFVLTLTGTKDHANALYSGEITVAAVPVPEPETYALMLAGLAGLGFVARRRNAL